MFREPFFQENILEHIIKYMSYYLGYKDWFMLFCGILLFLYSCYKFLMHNNNISYAKDFPSETYVFSLEGKKNVWPFVFLILCVVFNIFAVFNQEMSFFGNYDTRGNVIPIFERGLLPAWGTASRFYPLAFWDTNIIYAVTHNFSIINIYVSIQSIIVVLLLNSFLKFIPVRKRFICIGLFMISPVMFATASIVFSERILLIYIISGFICLQKYNEQLQKKYFLWLAVMLINFALYSKELCVLLYAGILIYYFLCHLWNGRIVPKNFLHPVKTARNYPFEVLLFLSLLIFCILYKVHMAPFNKVEYINLRLLDPLKILKIYYTEILITLTVLIFMVKSLWNKKIFMLMEGIALGIVMITIFITVIFKIGHCVPSMVYKSYYLFIPHMMGLIYIFWHLKNKYVIGILSCLLFINSIIKNYTIYQYEDGAHYRQVVEHIMKGKESSQVNIFLSKHLENTNWFFRSWCLPSKYYWPDADIRFFSSGATLKTDNPYQKDNLFYKEKPDLGDYVVVRKDEYYSRDIKDIPTDTSKKTFENKLFEVYLIQ